jgi:hypothetical protein
MVRHTELMALSLVMVLWVRLLTQLLRTYNGTIEIPRLEEEYGNATFGDKEPNVIATTVLGFSYLKEKLFGLQRYESVPMTSRLVSLV